MTLFTRLLACLLLLPALATAQDFTPQQKKAIEQITRDYLLANPEILLDMTKTLQQREAKKAQQLEDRTQQAMMSHTKAIFADPADPFEGNATGDVTLVVFFDYRCPHCKRFSPLLKRLMAHNPKLKVVYKELPIFGGASVVAAQAALAANQQGRYGPLHHALMASNKPLNKYSILATAKGLGLNMGKLKAAMGSAKVTRQLEKTQQLAQDLVLFGTPAVFIGPRVVAAKPDRNKLFYVPGVADEKALRELIRKAAQ